MFVLDDICGRFTISFGDVEYLQTNEGTLKRMLEKGKTKIAATCRLDIFSDEKFHASCSLFTSNIFNLSAEYSKEDKLSICTKIDHGTSRSKMKKVLDGIIGTYLRKTRNGYRVIHDQMFDFMCCYFGNNDTLVRCLLHNANINVLNERTQLESVNEQYGKFTMIISRKNQQYYFERIRNDLQLGKLTQCFRNGQMKHAKYRASFLKVLKSIDNDNLIDNDTIKENIITSCFEGYYEIVEYFISTFIDFNNGYLGNTPLIAACDGNHESIVQLLVDKECDVNQANRRGSTPMTAACYSENEKIVKLLIEKAGDINQVDSTDKGCNVNQAYDIKDTSQAASCVERKENVDRGCVDCREWTPLTSACCGGNAKIVQILIDTGVDVNQADDNGCDINQTDDMSLTPLTAACKRENETIVRLLIDTECDINQTSGMARTPLTAACSGSNEKIIQLLIDKGSDVNQVDGMGYTPLTAACKGGNEKIIQLLIDKGSDINQTGNMAFTPLTAACKRGNEKIVKLLIDTGCGINQTANMAFTPLTAACKGGNEKIVKLLLDTGYDINQTANMAFTSLIVAGEGGNEKIVQLLIDAGCDIKQTDDVSLTPLTAACKGGNEIIVQSLIDKGSDVNKVDGLKQTPLTAACMENNEKIVQNL
ncbi:unnamed protein product [Mytilus edulis]|uniref:Ankyrin repeat protein n=1 Tax=Mytilus edulis TaxID=6550 RepID=A0A8S3PQC4_MYTED|nr:unnamed protein product [Mytilus edulis]